MPLFIRRLFLALWLWNQKRLIRPLIKRLISKPFDECDYEETLELLHIISSSIPEELLNILPKHKLVAVELKIKSDGTEDLFRRLENFYHIMKRVKIHREKASKGFGVKNTSFRLENYWPEEPVLINLGHDCPQPKLFLQLMFGHIYNLQKLEVGKYLGELDHAYIERRTGPLWADLYSIANAILDAVLDLETDDILPR